MKKNGFTMVELLLCLAIIGVVAAMGMTITKRSTDKAYNLYYYTGYMNLYNAIADAKAEAMSTTNEVMNHVSNILDATPNRNIVPSGNAGLSPETIEIEMTVPQRKNKTNNGQATVKLLYINDDENGLLVPLVPSSTDVPDLQNRRDLLPVYIDDGFVGRTRKVGNSYEYKAPAYYSYREAYCKLNNNQSLTVSGNTVINCAGIAASNQANSGFLKIADPRKAR